MKGWILFCVGMPALLAGVPLAAQESEGLSIGMHVEHELAGSDGHRYSFDANGATIVTVDNLGRATILSIHDDKGELIARSANWRGPEHFYTAAFEHHGAIVLTVDPDERIAPAGRYRLEVESADANDPVFVAEAAMTQGAGLHLLHYFESENRLEEALEAFTRAAGIFAKSGLPDRQADALFEAANVQNKIGQRHAALGSYLAAEELWSAISDPDHRRSIASARNLRALIDWKLGNYDKAVSLFEVVASERSALGDEFEVARAYNNLGLVYRELGDPRLAMRYFQDALDYWQGDADLLNDDPATFDFTALSRKPSLQECLIAIQNLGWANEMFGDFASTERLYTQALALSAYLDRERTAAELRNNLGALYYRGGRLQEAKDLLDQSVAYFTSAAGNAYWAGRLYYNLARVHRAAGDTARAIDALESSIEFRTAEVDPVGRAESLAELAELSLAKNDLATAVRYTDEALSLVDTGRKKSDTVAQLLDLAARVRLQAGDPEAAIAFHDRAVEMYRSTEDRRSEARARANRAMTNRRLGRQIAAVQELRIALDMIEQVDSGFDEFGILTDLGEVYLEGGAEAEAEDHARRALELSEQIRSRLVHPVLLRNFAAVQRRAQEVLVVAALRRDSDNSRKKALLAADSARARRFSDLLQSTGMDVTSLSNEQRTRYLELSQEIATRAEARYRFLSDGESKNAELVTRELNPLIDEMSSLQGAARAASGFRRAEPRLDQIQSGLDVNEAIIEFFLGDAVAGYWTIRRDSITFHEYDRLDDIQDALTSAAESLRSMAGNADNIRTLSELLFSEVDDLAKDITELTIIPDGSLHFIPFAALLDPAAGFMEPLLVNRTIGYLPSMHALAGLRSRPARTGKGLAILADPVYAPDDPRVPNYVVTSPELIAQADERPIQFVLSRAGSGEFPRLPGTIREAKAIEASARKMQVLMLTGSSVNRDYVLAGNLERYKILHFATHGILDLEEPTLSGLVLSGVSEDGTRRSQFLRSQDIAGLNLVADLVVLSGCDTGSGNVVRGEGVIALSRAFFSAGANRVVSSLWQLPDTATAELMRVFYREMLVNEQNPRAALRIAQMEVRRQPQWSSPFFWAAFIVQGDR